MKSKIKTYRLLTFKFFLKTLFVLFLVLCLILIITGIIKNLAGFWNNNYKSGYAGIVLLLISFYLFYNLGLTIYLYVKYLLHERNTKIKIDFENETITMFKNSTYYVFDSQNLKSIEFHLSTKHYKNLLRYYGYTKLYSTDGKEFIITNFILNYRLIENMFNSVKKIKKLAEVIYLP